MTNLDPFVFFTKTKKLQDEGLKEQSDTESQENDTQIVEYPPYPGSITAEEYDQYFKDLTTETHIQTIHSGMVQVMDCIPTGIATD